MKEIKIPYSNIFSMTFPVQGTVQNITPSDVPTFLKGRNVQKVGTINVSLGQAELKIVRENGAKIIYGVIHIESQMDKFLALYFFGPTLGTPNQKKEFFVNEILEADRLSFFIKKELLLKVVDKNNILGNKEKEYVQASLKKVMDLRNAFAHGDLVNDNTKGCLLRFYSGGSKTIQLDDAYWQEIEDCFCKINELLKKIEAFLMPTK